MKAGLTYEPPPGDGDDLAALPGFGPGTEVMTDRGPVPVEWLATGDKVLTHDHGPQPVLWLLHLARPATSQQRGKAGALIDIAAGALGPGLPGTSTALAPRTRLLLTGWEVELHSGAPEALAEVCDLALPATTPAAAAHRVTLLLLPRHEVVQANGLWAETLLLDPGTRAALAGLLPGRLTADAALAAGHAEAARLCLSSWEVAAILSAGAVDTPKMIARAA